MTEINSIWEFRQTMRHGKYAWPGGYPRFLLMSDGGTLSFEAAKENRREILGALRDQDGSGGWLPVACYINWEDPDLVCSHSGKKIESAYGDD